MACSPIYRGTYRPRNLQPPRVKHEVLVNHSDNIRYDLLRSGNVELTSNKILERGFLPAVRPFTPCTM